MGLPYSKTGSKWRKVRSPGRKGPPPMSNPAPSRVVAASSPAASDNLALYELQKPFVEPLLRLFRLTNTALDALCYDVGVLTRAGLAHDTVVNTGTARNVVSSRH